MYNYVIYYLYLKVISNICKMCQNLSHKMDLICLTKSYMYNYNIIRSSIDSEEWRGNKQRPTYYFNYCWSSECNTTVWAHHRMKWRVMIAKFCNRHDTMTICTYWNIPINCVSLSSVREPFLKPERCPLKKYKRNTTFLILFEFFV